MKLTTFAFAGLIALAAAAPQDVGDDDGQEVAGGPPPPPPGCTPGTYACATNPKTGGPGWRICNTSRRWVYGGDCPPDTVCKFFAPSKSPYCVPADFEFP